QPLLLPIVLVGLVILQGLLGMWTVTLLLKPLIVVMHLLGGLATLSLLTWLAIPKQRNEPGASPGRREPRSSTWISLPTRALAGLIILGLQITLGGWTSSNYAALAC